MKFLLQISGVIVCAIILSVCAPVPFNDDNLPSKSFNIIGGDPIQAELLVTGAHCKIWAQKESGVTINTARMIADEYDSKIYSDVVSVFSKANLEYNGYTGTAMEYSDVFFGDHDGKLCILLLDIKDNYSPGLVDSYIAGYFSPYDLLANYRISNKCDMIYIDTYPGLNMDINNIYRTIAHELQHMLNFTTSIIKRWDGKSYIDEFLMDTWIDEGLSESAEWIYAGHSYGRIKWFDEDKTGLIGKGNNFFIWNNHDEGGFDETFEHAEAVLDDYSTAYLFFQWLRLQAESANIYSDIITSDKSDYNAVLDIINKYTDNYYDDWDTLLKTWLAANYIKSSSGQYGYKNDTVLNSIKTPSIPDSLGNVIPLYPGEGVYSLLDDSFTKPDAESKIKYISLSSESPVEDFTEGNVLLTYNASTAGITYNDNFVIIYPSAEDGVTTGIPLPVLESFPKGRFVFDTSTSPYRIGMQDMLRHNKARIIFHGKDFSAINFSGHGKEK